jgi:hypothetical protein
MHRLFIALLCCAAPVLASAQVFRCADGAGKLQYSDRPCTAGQQSEVKIDKHPEPVAPQAQRMGAEAQAYEAERAARRQQSSDSHARIDAAAAKVRQIKAENYDPRKCAAARARMAQVVARDPRLYQISMDYVEFSQAANTYCGN